MTRSDTYHDWYELVQGVPLPAFRRVITADDAGITLRQLLLSEHELLQGVDLDALGTDCRFQGEVTHGGYGRKWELA